MKQHSKSRWNTFPAKQISALLTKTSTIQKKKYKQILQSCQDCFKTTSELNECSYLSNTFCPWQTNPLQPVLDKLTAPQLVKKFPHFMKTRGSLLHSLSLPPARILTLTDPVHTPLSNFLDAHFNIIISSMPRTSKWPLSLRFPHQNPICTSPLLPLCVTCPAHCILFDLITQIIIGEDYRS